MLRAAEGLRRPLDQITATHLESYLARRDWAPATRRSVRASVRLFFAWCARSGVIERDPAADLPTVIMPRSLPRPASETATAGALATTDPRARLMVGLMAQCGLRRDEVARVRGGDLVGGYLRITGKGQHVRMVPIPADLAAAIRDAGPGWTFPGQIDGHLSARRVGEIVSATLPAGVTAHALRHRFATAVYARTRDIRAVQRLLGHARLDTTMIYVDVAADDLAEAARTAWSCAA